jgi:lipoprotein-releasing system ATP-binding protein
MSADIILDAKNIIKEFPSKNDTETLCVLDGVDMRVNAGTKVSIVGSSGSGKSTLLHILGGLDRPTSGIVEYRGTDLTTLNNDSLAAFRNKSLGFIFQFHHLLPEFTAIENVFMPGLINNKDDFKTLKDRAGEMLSKFGLGSRLHHRPSELSGGEQQRVAVARALINKPAVVLADEPTGNLDEKSTEKLLDVLFSAVDNMNLALVLVTHDMNIASACSITHRLEHGKLV